MTQTARQAVREYCRQGITDIHQIKYQEEIDYLSSLVVLEQKSAYILDSVCNNDELIHVFTAMAKSISIKYEKSGTGGEMNAIIAKNSVLDAVKYLNNHFAEHIINELFEEEKLTPIDE